LARLVEEQVALLKEGESQSPYWTASLFERSSTVIHVSSIQSENYIDSSRPVKRLNCFELICSAEDEEILMTSDSIMEPASFEAKSTRLSAHTPSINGPLKNFSAP
jgi:hypothetical protein